MLNLILLFVGFVVVIGALGILVKVLESGKEGEGAKKPTELAYVSTGALLTDAERAFYPVLVQAAEAGRAGTLVMCKVRLGDLIEPKRGLDRSKSTSLRNRANQKHIDFVLVEPETFGVIACVELDDSSHGRQDRQSRDRFVDGALEAAGVRLVRIRAARGYSLVEVAEGVWGGG